MRYNLSRRSGLALTGASLTAVAVSAQTGITQPPPATAQPAEQQSHVPDRDELRPGGTACCEGLHHRADHIVWYQTRLSITGFRVGR